MGNGKCWQHLFFGKLLLKRHRVYACVCLYLMINYIFRVLLYFYFKLFTYANHFLSVIVRYVYAYVFQFYRVNYKKI